MPAVARPGGSTPAARGAGAATGASGIAGEAWWGFRGYEVASSHLQTGTGTPSWVPLHSIGKAWGSSTAASADLRAVARGGGRGGRVPRRLPGGLGRQQAQVALQVRDVMKGGMA